MHLILEDRDIKFEPDFRLYEEALLNVYEFMLRSVSMVPRVETRLYPEWVRRSVCMFTWYLKLTVISEVPMTYLTPRMKLLMIKGKVVEFNGQALRTIFIFVVQAMKENYSICLLFLILMVKMPH